ncbi:hypothetical protein [Sphingorhabdus sp.]|uniref:hypothetical protein n=1 Tax=Sphingorhabdus sp. TaxID=1902408 RepID=UPI003BAFFD07
MAARSKIVEIGRNSVNEGDTESTSTGTDVEIGAVEPMIARGIDAGIDDSTLEMDSEADVDWSEYEEPQQRRNWKAIFAISVAILSVVGWSGFFVWANLAEFQSFPPLNRWVEMISSWSIPVALIAMLWLLAQRNSHAEARRFGDVSQSMRQESDRLNTRMQTVNGEIALARSFLAENAREIDSVGRQSADRLTEAASKLGSALSDADEKARLLAQVSEAAIANLEQLRNHLPVVTSAAKDATNNIAVAGNNAQSQIQSMATALEELSSKAVNARTEVDAMAERSAETTGQIASFAEKSGTALDAVLNRAETVAQEIMNSLEKRSEKVMTEFTDANSLINTQIESSDARLSPRLADLRSTIERLSATSSSEDERLSSIVARLGGSLDECEMRITNLNDDATDRIAKLAFAVSSLSTSNEELQKRLSGNRTETDALLSRVEQLMLGLDTASREMDEGLPAAFSRMQEKYETCQNAFRTMEQETVKADQLAAQLLGKIDKVDGLVRTQAAELDRLLADSETQFSKRHEQSDALAASLSQTRALIDEMTGSANEQLVTSLLRVRETTRQAAESSKQILDEELAGVARKMSEQNQTVLSEAVQAQITDINALMRDSVERNLDFTADASKQISAQLRSLDDMTANLERRIADARGQFDGLDEETFTRRMALHTESLNSSSIDVAKILSNEVTDTSWAAYLKGDRGVFTRRAVRLLDSGETKIIANHYDNDSEFRDHVNRYIHDFESMMRVLLSTRDGNSIGVTLLSSDVGKLYVALAQAIERLRS